MLKVKNYSSTLLTIDNVTIYNGGYQLFDSIKDTSYLNKLINAGKITVTNVDIEPVKQVEDVEPVTEIKNVHTSKTPELGNTDVVEVVTNTSTTKKKRSKDTNNNSEVENSKSTKGDMNNATD